MTPAPLPTYCPNCHAKDTLEAHWTELGVRHCRCKRCWRHCRVSHEGEASTDREFDLGGVEIEER